MKIRIATEADAEALLAIYAPYVEKTAVSFEYEPPALEEFRRRLADTIKTYPYIFAEEDGKIVGYAYAGEFHAREAYRYCVETSIYVDWNSRGRGIGRKLYETLEDILRMQGVCTVCACIAVPESEDDFLTCDSELFHRKMGYVTVGNHRSCGYKFDRWYGMIWMEKAIAEKRVPMPDFVKFAELRNSVEKILRGDEI